MKCSAMTECPSDFKRYLNHCYYFSTDIKYWGEAGQLCKLKGGYLAKIDDQLEEDFIVSVIQPLVHNGQIPGESIFLHLSFDSSGCPKF